VLISVSDEGIGISPDDVKSLFTTFHRIQRPETQGIRGSGLGLYIAKEWTEAMGGKIWVKSELNKGSTFYVSLPIKNELLSG
jgi:signal transduction histidine kinase